MDNRTIVKELYKRIILIDQLKGWIRMEHPLVCLNGDYSVFRVNGNVTFIPVSNLAKDEFDILYIRKSAFEEYLSKKENHARKR